MVCRYDAMTRAFISKARKESCLPTLLRYAQSKTPEVIEVTAKQSFWLLAQPKHPFRATALHPSWRTLHAARDEIESSSHANHYGHAQGLIMPRNPFLCFRTTKGHEHDIRLRVADPAHDFSIVHFSQGSERRRIMAHDLDSGVFGSKVGCRLFVRIGTGPQKENPVTALGSETDEFGNQVGACHAFRERILKQS